MYNVIPTKSSVEFLACVEAGFHSACNYLAVDRQIADLHAFMNFVKTKLKHFGSTFLKTFSGYLPEIPVSHIFPLEYFTIETVSVRVAQVLRGPTL